MVYTHKILRAWDAHLPQPDGRKVQAGLWVDATPWRNTFSLVDRRFLQELTAAELAQGPPHGMGHPDGQRPAPRAQGATQEPPAAPVTSTTETASTPASNDAPPAPAQPEDAKPAILPTPAVNRDDAEERRRQPAPVAQPGRQQPRRLPE